MKKNVKVLLIGGKGYIGSTLSKFLFKKKIKCTSIDNLLYEDKISINKKCFSKISQEFINKFDFIVILAGLVGDPITKKYPKYSHLVNNKLMKKLILKLSNSDIKKVIFVSTCSNYGLSKSKLLLKENAPLKPLSLYARDKVAIEKYIMKIKKTKTSFTILRFATAFGLSKPRMRFDLTLNEFILKAVINKSIDVYDEKTVRPYCHVQDFSNIIFRILNSRKELTDRQIINCGFNEYNFSKKKIINLIKKNYSKKFKVKYEKFSKDKRNYKVDFTKLSNTFNIKSKIDINKKIKEIISYVEKNKLKINKLKKMGNYNIFR